MDFQSTSSGVLLLTARVVADKRLLSSVCQLVCLQMPLGYKTLAASCTLEGALSCVCSHVGLEVAGLSEMLETALEWTQQEFDLLFRSFDTFNP